LFPTADPIPLPAPVWLMKLLSLVTLGLHFTAVMMLVGSLILVIALNFRGHMARRADLVSASWTLSKRHPVIMTYVINLGVPPLLFLQVLYGRQIYSSSILIAVAWISVIAMLIVSYWLLYKVNARMEASRPAWGLALLSLIIVMAIGKVYAMNMTLMLRPEVWRDMYAQSPRGLQMVTGDPTVAPRFWFVMLGGPLVGGLWAALLSNMTYLSDSVRTILRRVGGWSAVIGAAGMLVSGYTVMANQPEGVRQSIAAAPLYQGSLIACIVAVALSGLLGLIQGVRASSTLVGTLGWVISFVAATTAGIVRDGIRDFTLKPKGFDVYDVQVYPNWSVLIAFLLLFVLMLGIIYWLLQVMRQATPPTEEVVL
jgi:hypothetical protein